LVVIKRGHDQATPIPRQHALGLKPLQRLAHRRARHAHAFGELAFHQPVARLVSAGLNCFEDHRIGVFLHRLSSICPDTTPPPRRIKQIAEPATSRYACDMVKQHFSHVSAWVFDLDNTLYPPQFRLFDQIEVRMTAWVMKALGVGKTEADRLRQHYWDSYGTTLAGLMREHNVDPAPYLADVHDIDFSLLPRDPELAARIRALPGRRIVYTNACEPYAHRVLEARGLTGLFDAVYGVEHAGFRPKPEAAAFEAIFAQDGLNPATAAMFEDDPRNLAAPHAMGMRTVHVAPKALKARHIDHHTADLSLFLAKLT
jgi:putative hydrolase of the HAD superfamily